LEKRELLAPQVNDAAEFVDVIAVVIRQ